MYIQVEFMQNAGKFVQPGRSKIRSTTVTVILPYGKIIDDRAFIDPIKRHLRWKLWLNIGLLNRDYFLRIICTIK